MCVRAGVVSKTRETTAVRVEEGGGEDIERGERDIYIYREREIHRETGTE